MRQTLPLRMVAGCHPTVNLSKTLFLTAFLLFAAILNAQYDYVVINEISGDGGNAEAGNDAIVEIAGPPGTNIGCMVITNTEWAVVLPANTQIPADSVFLVGCEERNNRSLGFYTGPNVGLSCSVCDFPGLVVDFDVCSAANINYVSPSLYSTYGFTLDNQPQNGNKDGDQVILFRPDGTPHDAVYWGAPDVTRSNGGGTTVGGSSGNSGAPSDHVSVQINHSYTLGDNDENGVVNDNMGPHIGYRANGGNATAVNVMPNGNDDLGNPKIAGLVLSIPPGDCNSDRQKYTVPALSNPIWVNLGLNLTACNSTHIRINDTSPAGNSRQEAKTSTTSSHMDDPDLNADWQAFAPTALVPSSINAVTAAAQWQITNHPNPGRPNDTDAWDFFYNIGSGNVEITDKNSVNLNICDAQTVTFELKVYNHQHVEPTITSSKLAGSFVRDEAGIDRSWTIEKVGHTKTVGTAASDDDGTTTFKFTSNTLAVGQTHSFTLVWDDYTDCCGSGKNSTVVNQSNPHECYEKVQVNITVGTTVAVTKSSLVCPRDFTTNIGTIDFSNFLTSANALVQYRLKQGVTNGMEATTGTTVSTNKTGLFNLTNTLTTPIAVIVEDLANCGANQIITIGNDCRNAPPCPKPNGATISATTVCPNEMFTLSVNGATSTDLPNGGTIDWYYGTTNTFNPLDKNSTGFGGKLANSSTITSPCPAGGSNVFISELSDPSTGWQCHRYIEIYNGGPCSQNLDGWNLYAIGNNNRVVTFALSGILAPGEAKVAGANCATNFTPDFVIPGNEDWDGGPPGNFNGQSRDGAELRDNQGDLVDMAVINTADNNNWFENNRAVRLSTVCSGFTTGTTLCGTASSCADFTNNWQRRVGNAGSTPGTHTVSTGTCPSAVASVTTATNSLPSSICNQSLFIKGVVNPATVNTGTCTQSDFTTDTLMLTVECPSADLQTGDKNLCLPVNASEVLARVNLTGGTGSYNVVLATRHNGTDQMVTLNGISHPLNLTYQQVQTALGTPHFSNVELSLLSVTDAGGRNCTGAIDGDIVLLSIGASTTGNFTAATNLTDCSGTENGAVTLSFTPTDSGPWTFEYRVNGGSSISAAASTSPFTLPTAKAGNYELITAQDELGCPVSISGTTTQTVNTPTSLMLTAVTIITICNDGTEQVDLNQHIDLTINDNGTVRTGNAATIGHITWYKSDPTFLPTKLRPAILASTIPFVPVGNQDFFYVYTRPSDGCEVIGKTTILSNASGCCSADAGDLVMPVGLNSIQYQGKVNIGAITASYAAAGKNNPGVTNFQYAFLLIHEDSIMAVSSTGIFNFNQLDAGVYNIMGISYANSNTPTSVLDYLEAIQLDNNKQDIAQLEKDENGLTFCLNLSDLVGSGFSPVMIHPAASSRPDAVIPTMNQWGVLIFALLCLNMGLIFLRALHRLKDNN
ncbi:MAG: lamin tail domain-containing protein [Bacteroidota bacterium]